MTEKIPISPRSRRKHKIGLGLGLRMGYRTFGEVRDEPFFTRTDLDFV